MLVLWRGFTWTLEGSPKKNFKLSAKAILEHEKTLHEIVLAHADQS